MTSISYYSPPPDVGASRYSTDYLGSRDEWVFRTARDMATRYAMGDQSMLDNLSGATAGIGQPNRSDFGTGANGGTAVVSGQTYDFWARYVETYGASDPYISAQYGAPPQRAATYTPQQSPQDFTRGENALNRAHDLDITRQNNQTTMDIASMNNATDLQIASMQDATAREGIAVQREGIQAELSIAALNNATDRYIAEGNWGVQRYVAELQESGAMERLKLELGMRDKELAQRAVEAQQQYHVAMLGLVMEVAQYDAELAASPRNWVAYAEWLQNKNVVVNGMTLAMAADMVPPDTAAMTAANTGTQAGQYSAQTAIQYGPLVSGESGGATSTMDPMGDTQPMPQQQQAQQGGNPYQVAGVDLSSTNYGQMVNQLTGNTQPATTPQLQQMYDSTQGPQTRAATFATAQTSNGVNVNPLGNKQNFSEFMDLMPVQQEIALGGVQGVRGAFGVNDFLKEMDRARPKGDVQGVAGMG